jgi:hypothetical protein
MPVFQTTFQSPVAVPGADYLVRDATLVGDLSQSRAIAGAMVGESLVGGAWRPADVVLAGMPVRNRTGKVDEIDH